jgi:hypothetical protein
MALDMTALLMEEIIPFKKITYEVVTDISQENGCKVKEMA